jgi:hypothetical protein
MDDYDGFYNCNSFKYSPFENFENFWFIIFFGDQNYDVKSEPPCSMIGIIQYIRP